MRDFKYYLPGTILIALALLILAVPEILIAFISAVITMLGIAGLYVGHLIKKSNNRFETADYWIRNHTPYGWRFAREPIFERRYRTY